MDFNNDGFLDLVITTAGEMYTGGGDGTFTDITVSMGVTITHDQGAWWA